MDVIQLLEYLQEIIESAPKVPITGKIILDKNEVIDIIDQVVNYLPDEFKKAQWVIGEKERILAEANKQLETAKKETMEIMKRQVENHDITREAKVKAQEIIALAQRDAKTMRLGARDYADEILCQLNKQIEEKAQTMALSMKQNMEDFMNQIGKDVNDTSSTIRNNIKELRNMK